DEMHVMHARRTRRHAGETREAAVDVLYDLACRGLILLQHFLDEINAAARGVEFVAEQDIGRTSRGAESAMHAGAQNLVRFRDIRIGELCEGEVGLHCTYTLVMAGLVPAIHAFTALRKERRGCPAQDR